MSDPFELAAAAVSGGGGVGAFVLWLLRRGERASEKTEETAATKLDLVLSSVTELQRNVAVLVNDLGTHKVSVEKLAERVQGISDRYGPKLDQHAERLATAEANIAALAKRRGK